jgi:hypothetical protein
MIKLNYLLVDLLVIARVSAAPAWILEPGRARAALMLARARGGPPSSLGPAVRMELSHSRSRAATSRPAWAGDEST